MTVSEQLFELLTFAFLIKVFNIMLAKYPMGVYNAHDT